MNNNLRISGGEFRGRKIATPGGKTHPMGERERLALFNMLGEAIMGARVLDAFAGSGALGIEALSRGAPEVMFVDNSEAAIRTIKANLRTLGVLGGAEKAEKSASQSSETAERGASQSSGKTEVIRANLADFEAEDEFDVILADPPYDDFRPEIVQNVTKLLKKQGILVLSHPNEVPTLDGLNLQKTRKYAGVNLSFYEKM